MAVARMDDQRRSDRVPVRLVTTHGGGNYPLTLLNVSTTGMLVSSPRKLRVGDEVRVDLPELGDTLARVMWGDTDEYGCQFVRPIPESVVYSVEEASRRNRSRSRPQQPRRRHAEMPDKRDDTKALVALVVFLAFIIVLFYAGQALFVE